MADKKYSVGKNRSEDAAIEYAVLKQLSLTIQATVTPDGLTIYGSPSLTTVQIDQIREIYESVVSPGSRKDFYSNGTIQALTTALVKVEFPFYAKNVILTNDSAATIYFSFDGVVGSERELKIGESIPIQPVFINELYLKGTAGGEAYRLNAF